MNSYELAVIIFTLVGVVVAFVAPGIALGLVALAIGVLFLFGPRAGD